MLRTSRRGLPLGDRAALTFAFALLVVQALRNNEGASGVDPRGFDGMAALLLAAAVALAVAARWAPARAALGLLALTVAWHQSGYTSGVINVPYLVGFYLLGATGDRRRQLVVGGVAVTAMLVGMIGAGDESVTSVAAAVGWTMAALLFGEVTHNRRALVAEYEARALRAEAERDAEAERRVAETRLGIARDLHDVLAHTVSVMTVQAGVGQDALARGSDGAAATALGTIRAAGREAMEEIQAMVAVLRNGADPTATAPAPRLDRLGDLVAVAEAAGVHIDLTVDVPPGAATEIAELTAYRVVQESLTNVVRHAQARTATVKVGVDGPDLRVEIADDGIGRRSPTGGGHQGFGLDGMRERVESLGGHLQAGPDQARGWRVTATIPRERRRAP
ncbi:MAG TPA: histidine kinase [Acidimicrobiales bacterium]|nr:histidine kinase [Acidimicrobiales bacterium]